MSDRARNTADATVTLLRSQYDELMALRSHMERMGQERDTAQAALHDALDSALAERDRDKAKLAQMEEVVEAARQRDAEITAYLEEPWESPAQRDGSEQRLHDALAALDQEEAHALP